MFSEAFSNVSGSYFIDSAKFCKVGAEWNNNIWNPRNNPNGYHALYYRTDHSDARAMLHMLDGSIELVPDRIFFISAYSVLYSEISGQMQKYFIHFRSDCLGYGLHRHKCGYYSVPANALTEALFNTVVENFANKSISSEKKVSGAMDILLSDILENVAVLPRDTEKFQPVLEYIDKNYKSRISVAELARLMNLSTVYFSNIFRDTFHISPKQYIVGKLLFESQRLLIHTDMSVREIAEELGFDNENYFSEFFSQKVGISALKYRSKSR